MWIYNALEVIVIPSDQSDEELSEIQFTYELVDYQEDSLQLQFNFENPE